MRGEIGGGMEGSGGKGRETLKEAGIIENDTRSTKDCLKSGF